MKRFLRNLAPVVVVLAALSAIAATASLRINGLRYPDGTGVPSGYFNVKQPEWGAVGDGVTDDTAAIQAAVTAAQVKGGTVYFPSANGERYKITSTITVSSIYPVNLISNMSGFTDNQTTGSFIMPGANFGSTPMFKYQAPGGTHGAHGAGLIRGLAFYDPFNGNHTPNYTMIAAIDLQDFSLGTVENCYFNVLNGGAIRAINWVMGAMDKVVVRYSGTVSQPAISFEPTGSPAFVQSLSVTNVRAEVNYGTYISLNSNTQEVKFSNVGMEADTSIASSNNTMLSNAGTQNYFNNFHLNRDTATQWSDTGSQTEASNISIFTNSSQTSTVSMNVTASEPNYSNIMIRSGTARTTNALTIASTYGKWSNIDIGFDGGILVSGSLNTINGVAENNLVSASVSYGIDLNGGSYNVLSGAVVNTPPANMGGIRVTGTALKTSVVNCKVIGVSGTGVGFRDENSSNATVWAADQGASNVADFSATATSYTAVGNTGITTRFLDAPVFTAGATASGSSNFDLTGSSGQFKGPTGGIFGAIDSSSGTWFAGVNSSSTSISKAGTTMTVNGAIKANQGMAVRFDSLATPVTAAITNGFVGVSGTGARTVALPAASTCIASGQELIIQDIGNSAGVITISPNGTDTINGVNAAVTIAAAYGRRVMYCQTTGAWYTN